MEPSGNRFDFCAVLSSGQIVFGHLHAEGGATAKNKLADWVREQGLRIDRFEIKGHTTSGFEITQLPSVHMPDFTVDVEEVVTLPILLGRMFLVIRYKNSEYCYVPINLDNKSIGQIRAQEIVKALNRYNS
jgi:hypothetical protein